MLLALSLSIFALFLSLWFTLPDGAGYAANSPTQRGTVKTQTEISSGLQRIIFTTPRGSRIFVNLPEDVRPGETFSGSVFNEVSGTTDAERAAATEELRNYVVEIAGQRMAAGKTFELKTPASIGVTIDNLSGVVLRDAKGKEVARAQFKVASQATGRPGKFRLPTAQLGEMIQIECDCDGVMAGTDYVRIGGQASLPIAESPGMRWAFNTGPAKGPTEIEISERGQVIRGTISVLGIKLTAEKTGLLKGESTTLSVEVSGLEGLKEPMPLRLENKTPDVLTMQPSNVQELTIKPGEVQPGGKYTTQRTLTGIRVGNFFIEGTVVRTDEPVSVVDTEQVAFIQTDQEAARIRDALIQRIQNLNLPRPPQPEITSVYPAIGSLVKESPRISWKVSRVPGEVQRVFYSIRIVEVLPEQSLQDALLRNKPALERTNLTEDFYQVPKEGGLQTGRVYALRISAFGPGGMELGRISNSFFAIGSWPSWTFCWLFGAPPVDYCIGQNSGVTVAYSFMTTSGAFSWTLTPLNTADPTVTGTSPAITIPANLLPTTTGPHIYTLVATKGSCSRTLTITINAYTAAVGGGATVAPVQICDGQTAVLDVQGETGNVGQWEYSDTGPNGPWLSATNAFFIAGAPANTNQMQPSSCTAPNWYTDRRFRAVVYTSGASNAPACSTTYSTPTTLRIYCKPKAGQVTASTTRYCKYAPPPTITLTMSGTVIGDFNWYSNPGGLMTGHQNQTSFSVPAPTTTTTYWTTVTTNGSCSAVNSNFVRVTVDDQPYCTSPGTAVTVDNSLVCPGDAATLKVNNCSGIVTWQQAPTCSGPWTSVSQGNSVQNTTDLYANTCWRAIISGPPGGTCPAIISNTVPVNVKPPPAIPVVATPGPVCFGGSATLTSNLPPLPLNWTYLWYRDDLQITACNNLPTCTFTPAEPGAYWVEVSNGCQTVRSNAVILPVDVVTVNINAPCCGLHVPLMLSASGTSTLSGAITNPGAYAWTANGVPIGGGMNKTVNPSTTTTYCVTVISPTGCKAQSCATVTVCP